MRMKEKKQLLAKGEAKVKELQEAFKTEGMEEWSKYVAEHADVLGVSMGAQKMSETNRREWKSLEESWR